MEERERLHSLFVRAASELLRIYGHAQRYEEGITVARRLLTLDPFRESIHRNLLLLLVLDGQRAEALRHHERWRASFHRELNIDPAPQTLRLVDQVRSGRIFEHFDSIRESYFLPGPAKPQRPEK
jgi:DNA-binding SARP family transcriptional activator